MRRQTVFDSLISLETLDLRLSPTSLSLGASLVPPAIGHLASTADDALPDPEPSTGPNPLVFCTELPPTGPAGPGTS